MEIPIPTLHLFKPLDAKLLALLRSLSADEWHSPTLAKAWNVKDIAAHLLDGNIRTLSVFRDNYVGDPAENIKSYTDLVRYLDRLNADWVKAMKRMSPSVLIELLEQTGQQYIACLSGLDPFAPSRFAVDWAGESESENWFHIAREYTEKWHHQQQIREAVKKPGIIDRESFYPVLDTFMRGLPHAYRNVNAKDKTTVVLQIEGPAGGTWQVQHISGKWKHSSSPSQPATKIIMGADIAWKLFTKGIDPSDSSASILVNGDSSLAEPLLNMISVMAIR